MFVQLILFVLLTAAVASATPFTLSFWHAPPGDPVFVHPGELLFVGFSVGNLGAQALHLWQSGLAIGCLNSPCNTNSTTTYNTLLDQIGPLQPGVAPGTTFGSALYTVAFGSSDNPDNAFVLTPRINFTSYSSSDDIQGPSVRVYVVPEPAFHWCFALALLLGAGLKRALSRTSGRT